MKQTDKKKIASKERKYVKVYFDFIRNQFLSTEEKMVFIALKSFLDFSTDNNGTQGEVFPAMETICKLSSLSRPRATKAIKKLIEKKIVKKLRRGLTKSNIYTLSDYDTMWTCDNPEDMATAVDNKGIEHWTPEEHIAELERMGYKVEIKEKGLESEPTKAQNQAPEFEQSDIENNTINSKENQASERYTLEQIHQLFDYDIMIHEYPMYQQDIDAVMNILHTAMNADKTIRAAGQDKPYMTVISRLMKLNKEYIIYAIERFSRQTDLIKNPISYMLTILYQAPEQYYLDTKNQISHDMGKEDSARQENREDTKNRKTQNDFTNFHQREYDYEELEKNLLAYQKELECSEIDIVESLKSLRE